MSKVKIYTWADKAPEFLYKQYETIKNFVKDEDWEFIVFNNVPAPKTDRQKQIKKICKELGVKCFDVRFRSFVSGAAQICAWGIHWAYHRFLRWEKDTIHVILDSDMFFISDFNFNDYLGDNDICAIHQRRGDIEYLWNGFTIMRGGNLPDKNHFDYRLGKINGERTDVGGRLYWWLKRNPNLKVKYIKHTGHLDVSKSEMLPEKVRAGYRPEYCFQFIEHSIIHYRAGSNWDKKSKNFVDEKKNYFKELLDELLYNNGKIKNSPELYMDLEPYVEPKPGTNKVKIYTWSDKAPEFLYKQYETIKRFVKDEDWEFIVFNNTPINAFPRRKAIKKACKKLKIKCLDVRFRTFISGASYITGWGISWAFHRFFRWEKDTIHVILDSDMFFISDFNFNEYLRDNDICAIHQRRGDIEYLWNGFVIIRGGELPDKNHFDYRLGTVEGERTDTGGNTYYWLKRNPDLKIKYMMHTGHLDAVSKTGMLPENFRLGYKPEYCFQFIENSVLHYRAGSNWEKRPEDFVDTKKRYLNALLDNLLYEDGQIQKVPELCNWKQ
ncbi:MAG: hypothetical protein WCY19_01125 [Candidatus Gastranaerophilaceae bacterium]